MGIIQGRNILIYAGSSGTTPAIAGAKSCTIMEQCDLMEKASASNQNSKEFEAGRTEWEISISHLVMASAEYEGLIKVGTTLQLSVVVNGVRKVGSAICQHAEIGGTAGNLATGSVRLKGSGPLSSNP